MKNKNQEKKIIWKFTNQRKLTGSEFVRYFEAKVRKTIRKYKMPICKLRKQSLNTRVINNIIKDLPERKGRLSEDNLNDISSAILYIIIHQQEKDLKKLLPKNQPLYFLSDAEIELYAKLKRIKGKIMEEKDKFKEVDSFIKIIEEKNPDIRQNIVQALLRTR